MAMPRDRASSAASLRRWKNAGVPTDRMRGSLDVSSGPRFRANGWISTAPNPARDKSSRCLFTTARSTAPPGHQNRAIGFLSLGGSSHRLGLMMSSNVAEVRDVMWCGTPRASRWGRLSSKIAHTTSQPHLARLNFCHTFLHRRVQTADPDMSPTALHTHQLHPNLGHELSVPVCHALRYSTHVRTPPAVRSSVVRLPLSHTSSTYRDARVQTNRTVDCDHTDTCGTLLGFGRLDSALASLSLAFF